MPETADQLEVSAEKTPVWPILAGVGSAWIALDNIVPWMRRGSIPRVGLVLVAASLLLIAVMISGVLVRLIFARLYLATRRVTAPVVRAACLAALWVPAWVLFVETWSLLMIAAGAICLACVGVFLKQCEIEAVPGPVAAAQHQAGTPFLFEQGLLARSLLPSLLLVALLDVVIALAGARWFVAASVVAGIFAGVLGWRAVGRSSPSGADRPLMQGGRQVTLVAAAFVTTVIALLPYLRMGIPGGLSKIVGPPVAKNSPPGQQQGAGSEGYPGIIMLPLNEQQKKIIAPAKRNLVPHFGVKIAEPMEIPFDGQYWYFKWPDKRPRSKARVVRGSSTKTQVSSSDHYPLAMEAHQKLAEPIDLGCCTAMELVVENADQLSGAIDLELWVKKLPGQAPPLVKQKGDFVPPEQQPHYLGTVTIPSSARPIGERPNASGRIVEEMLRYPIPAAMDGIEFDEITVVVRTAPERARMGAKVAVKKFVLEP